MNTKMKMLMTSIIIVLTMIVAGFTTPVSANDCLKPQQTVDYVIFRVQVEKLDTNGVISYRPAKGVTISLSNGLTTYVADYRGLTGFGCLVPGTFTVQATTETQLFDGTTVRSDSIIPVQFNTDDQIPNTLDPVAEIIIKVVEDSPYLNNTSITGYTYGSRQSDLTTVVLPGAKVILHIPNTYFGEQVVYSDANGKFTFSGLNPLLNYRIRLGAGYYEPTLEGVIVVPPSDGFNPNYVKLVTPANGDESVVTYTLRGEIVQ